jgi:hypothetical protein
MKYTEKEILDILKLTCDNPEQVLLDWNNNKANTPVEFGTHDHFVYSFPMIVDEEEVATITLASLYSVDGRDNLMQKYFGHEDYKTSWDTFSHDTYKFCYLTIHKDFKLPKIVKGMKGQKFIGKDAKGNEFQFAVCYGYPTKENDSHYYHTWISDSYRFDDGTAIKIDEKQIQGWSLGKKINENIKVRVRDQKINEIVKD